MRRCAPSRNREGKVEVKVEVRGVLPKIMRSWVSRRGVEGLSWERMREKAPSAATRRDASSEEPSEKRTFIPGIAGAGSFSVVEEPLPKSAISSYSTISLPKVV